MDMKRLMTGAVVGGLTLFAMGYLAYEVLLVDFFAANATGDAGREALIFPAIIAGEILMGALLTRACDWSGSTGWQACAKTGATVGFLAWGAAALITYGVFDLSTLTATIADPLVTMVRAGVAGAVIGMVVAKGDSGAAAAPASDY